MPNAEPIQPKEKFPEYAGETKIAYVEGHAKELHLRKCRLVADFEGNQFDREFDQSVITIGAMEDNDIVVNHDTVSRYHCKIVQEKDAYVLVDTESTNGSYINRVRIREAYLRNSASIQVGKVQFTFHFADERMAIVPSKKTALGNLVGNSRKMREIYAIIEKIAPTNTTVIIEGETGTGKEVVAQAIHSLSKRARSPIAVFDCGAVPENLIESELFGHEKGAFTGAISSRQGIFEQANTGTVFLDELGELNIELQPKLLRVLEQREVRRVGSNTPIKVNVRVIAATNRDLEEEVKEHRFRQDLFYRLSVVRLELPPLRERPEDIPQLIEHFLGSKSFNKDGHEQRIKSVEDEAMELLTTYQWPGNVRELLNVVEHAVSFADTDVLRAIDLPSTIRPVSEVSRVSGLPIGTNPGANKSLPEGKFKDAKEQWVSSFEREYLVKLLRKNNGNISHAAREADIDRKYFRKLMKKYEIDVDAVVS